MKEGKIKNMVIKQNDMVRLKKVEPNVTGRVVEVFDNKIALIRWEDGILVQHYVDELKVVRLDEIAGPWMGF
jgi:hypothetical protein